MFYDLVLRAKQNDKEAFLRLYEGVYKELYQLAYYTLRNTHDAEDVVSETVIAAYESIGKLKKPESFKGWICKIAINKCNQKIRQYMKRETTLSPDMEVKTTDSVLLSDIRSALGELDYEERMIVILHVLWGYKGEEIGKILHIKHSTIRSKYRRSLEKMKVKLQT